MDFTIEVSKAFNLSPFSVLEQDADKVIMLINYFIEKGETTETHGNALERTATHEKAKASKKYDGFWDM